MTERAVLSGAYKCCEGERRRVKELGIKVGWSGGGGGHSDHVIGANKKRCEAVWPGPHA